MSNRTFWVGDVEPWMTETYLFDTFSAFTKVDNVKIIRERSTGMPAGYAFVEFATHEEAMRLFEGLNGEPLVSASGTRFRVSWAMQGLNITSGPMHTVMALWVANFGAETRDAQLYREFAKHYPSVFAAKVIQDNNNKSRGYGFVHFNDEADAKRALQEMPGELINGRQILVKHSLSRSHMRLDTHAAARQEKDRQPREAAPRHAPLPPGIAKDTIVVVTGLEPGTTEVHLTRYLGVFGAVAGARIVGGETKGTVEFHDQESVSRATSRLANVHRLGNRPHVHWQDAAEAWVAAMVKVAAEAGAMTDAMHAPTAIQDAAPPNFEHFCSLLRDPLFTEAFEKRISENQGHCEGACQTGGSSRSDSEFMAQNDRLLTALGSIF